MFYKKFCFYNKEEVGTIAVTGKDLYTPTIGYGFVTERNRNLEEALQITELNSGFEPHYWLKGDALTKLIDTPLGVSIDKGRNLPLIFKVNVPWQGNYYIRINITAGQNDVKDLIIFAGRRRLIASRSTIPSGETFTVEATINIGDIIPRGMTRAKEDTSFDLAILGDSPVITELVLKERECPTIYVAGDSTVTDQGAAYPYNPGCCYCGWAQMLPYYLRDTIALSNHAHSGLTTLSFRSEGHYEIIRKNIKQGDYFFFQFAHNDQKQKELSPYGGYMDQVHLYVEEIKALGAYPVIVTPIARNTWKNNGDYNDLLIEYAKVCREVGKELNVPVIDLHKMSREFVEAVGLETASGYYYPKDYTHSNDYGGFLMAGFVAEACTKVERFAPYIKAVEFSVKDYKAYVNDAVKMNLLGEDNNPYWIPPKEIVLPKPPAEYNDKTINTFQVSFDDIDTSPEKAFIIELTKMGVITNTGNKFRPNDYITRAEALDWVVKGVRFVPTEVYNDRFLDVMGHEWYAGIVETACQNDILREDLVAGGLFHPLDRMNEEQIISFCICSYKCRKKLKNAISNSDIPLVSKWAKEDINTAVFLNLIDENFKPKEKLTREKAAYYVNKLIDKL